MQRISETGTIIKSTQERIEEWQNRDRQTEETGLTDMYM